jgi:hypothetical protein
MATTNATQAASGVASKDGGRRGVRAALAAGVVALGLATALGLGHAPRFLAEPAPAQPVLTAGRDRIGYLVQAGNGIRRGYGPALAWGGKDRIATPTQAGNKPRIGY